MIPPGIEPGTLSVLDSRDNRYTMESHIQIIATMQCSYNQLTEQRVQVGVTSPSILPCHITGMFAV